MLNNKLSVFILLTATIILLSSCDVINNCLEIYQSTKQFNSADTISSSALSYSSYENSQQQNTNGKFDIEEIRKKLWLNGKQFTLPCTAEDLGDEYYFDDDFTMVKVYGEEPDPTYYNCGMYSKKFKDELKYRIGVLLKDTSRGDNLLKKQICSIIVDHIDINFKIDRIDMKSTKQEVINFFGEPTIILGKIGEKQIYQYCDSQNNNNSMIIRIENDGSISELWFTYGFASNY